MYIFVCDRDSCFLNGTDIQILWIKMEMKGKLFVGQNKKKKKKTKRQEKEVVK